MTEAVDRVEPTEFQPEEASTVLNRLECAQCKHAEGQRSLEKKAARLNRGATMRTFNLGDIVRLKETGEDYDIMGVEESGRHMFIVPRTLPGADGMWVRVDEIEIRLRSYPGGRCVP